ncbi:MAG: hypothetical protein N4A57_16550 [Anaeromicrobium sp.]|jgi:membrane protein implicated in regulation of membrane protease activity|uniref:hypothetical protein n=1 Tax=Anaeromicrobium sp. TaxID=1929132 RepID=UPI0025DA4D18|nr:hypothetical protein [Anaeromicrobium sp.]MCT4595858.1 hypothetical protein [Anaeromicrobium sp.]
MLVLYKIAFFTGVLYTIVSLILGQLFNSIDLEGGLEGDIDLFNLIIFPIKPITVVIFITVFGGVGIMNTYKNLSTIYTLVLSFLFAYTISTLVYRLIIAPLHKSQNTSAPSKDEIMKLTGKVKTSIVENGFGEITYTIHGNTYNAPAKHVNGKYVKSGTDVYIIDIKENIFYVEFKNFYY